MSLINRALKAGLAVLLAALIFKAFTWSPSAFIQTPSGPYDFIVVGGGSAGSVVAARLSEHYSVLLVEAGGQFGYLASVPLAAPFLQGSANDWQHRTERQAQSSYGLVDQVSFWPRGKGLGGSGQLNYLVHYPGRKEDWEAMAAAGVQGWSQGTMAHYMARLKGKSYRPEQIKVTAPACAEDGLVTCSTAHCHVNASRLFLQASGPDLTSQRPVLYTSTSRAVLKHKPTLALATENAKANPLLAALTGAAQELRHLRLAVAAGQSTVLAGRRWSSLQSHLLPALASGRLHVLLDTPATRVVFRGAHARGVMLGPGGFVEAQREVVVCAGAVATPHLLQLSGVGPRPLLEHFGVPVVADLPVGSNLHDHLNVPLYVSLEQPVSLTISKILRVSQVLKYALLGKGVFARSAVAGTVIAGDAGLLLFGMGSTEEKLFRVISNYKAQVFNAVFPEHRNHSAEGLVFLATCLRPRSRGHVQLKSLDPTQAPAIQPNYLHDPYDVSCTIQAIRLARRLLLTAPFQRLGARLRLPALDECADYEPSVADDLYLECLVRAVGITSYHPAGTASMGNLSHSVLDSAFRVDAVSGLRVVDSSALATPLLGTPHSVLLAMADRAATFILAEANATATSRPPSA